MPVYIDSSRRNRSKCGLGFLMAAWPPTDSNKRLLDEIANECEGRVARDIPLIYRVNNDHRARAIELGAKPVSNKTFREKFRFAEDGINVNP